MTLSLQLSMLVCEPMLFRVSAAVPVCLAGTQLGNAHWEARNFLRPLNDSLYEDV